MEYQLKSRIVRVAIDEEFGMYDDQTRFDIYDLKGNLIDDAQGYGYKSAQSAHKAAAYKFKGGKQKSDAAKLFWRKHPDFAEKMLDELIANVKEPLSDEEIIAFAAKCGIDNFDVKLLKSLSS